MTKMLRDRGVVVSLLALALLLLAAAIGTVPWFFWAAWLLMTAYLVTTALGKVAR